MFVFLNTYVHTYESLPIYQVSIELDMQCRHFFAVLYTYKYALYLPKYNSSIGIDMFIV